MMHDLVDLAIRLGYVAVGAIVGFYLGITRNIARQALREAHDLSEELHHHERVTEHETPQAPLSGPPGPEGHIGPKGKTGDDRDSPFMRKMMFVTVLIVAIYATYFATKSESRLNTIDDRLAGGAIQRAELQATQEKIKAEVRCLNKIEVANTDAQKARALFAEQQAEITLRLYTVLLDPKTSGDEFTEALKVAKQATADSLAVAGDNPFPPIQDVRDCIK